MDWIESKDSWNIMFMEMVAGPRTKATTTTTTTMMMMMMMMMMTLQIKLHPVLKEILYEKLPWKIRKKLTIVDYNYSQLL